MLRQSFAVMVTVAVSSLCEGECGQIMTLPKLSCGVLDLMHIPAALTQIPLNVAVQVGLRTESLRVI